MISKYRALSSAVAVNAAWIFSGGAASAVFAFLASIFVARYFTIQEYGILQLATTYFLFTQLLEQIANVNVSKIAILKNPHRAHLYQRAIGQIVFGIYLLAVVFLLILYFFVKDEVLGLVTIMVFGQLFRFSNGIAFYFDVHLQAKKNQIATVLGSIGSAIYRIFGSVASPTAFFQAFFNILANLVSLVTLIFFYNGPKEKILFWFKVDREISIEIIEKSAPMLLTAFVSLVVYKIDVVLLGFFGREREISFYSNAVKLSEPWGFVAFGLVSSMFPVIVLARNKSLSKYYSRIKFLFFLLFYIALVLAIVGTLFARPIVLLTFGPQYLPTVELLRVHIWSNIFLFFMMGQQVWEVNEGLQRFTLYKYIIAATFNVIANVIFIPQLGALACSVVSVVSYFLVAIGLNFGHRKGRFFIREVVLTLFSLKLNFQLIRKFIGNIRE